LGESIATLLSLKPVYHLRCWPIIADSLSQQTVGRIKTSGRPIRASGVPENRNMLATIPAGLKHSIKAKIPVMLLVLLLK
jgi:hypothetical protein